MISWWRTTFGDKEIANITNSIKKENISQGSVTEAFESSIAKALNVPYAVATTSGSMALLMALMALDIKRDDEVIVPNRTWIATAHAPLMLGAKVVLIDVRSDIPIIDESQIRQKITSRTKAIIPVHLNGRTANMKMIRTIAEEYNLHVVEDACQALFSKDPHLGYLGTQSEAGCFSLSVAKLISTGQGGVVVVKKEEIYEKLKLIRTHGIADVVNPVYTQLGFNFRFNDILASIGLAQLTRVQTRISHMKSVYDKYKMGIASLPYIKCIPVNVSEGEVPLYFEVLCDERERLMEYLFSCGIQTRPFSEGLNMAGYLSSSDKYPNSKAFGKRGLVLPCGPGQSFENIDRVLEVLQNYA
jgi:perosamine synthetase